MLNGAQKIDAYKLTVSQKTREYEMTGSQKTRVCNLMGARKIDAYKLMASQKTREYNLKGAQKIAAYEMTDARKTREYEQIDAPKTREYEMTGAQNVRVDESKKSCVQTEKVKNPSVKNSSCVGVWKNDGVEIIHNNQGNRICQDADLKPIVRDPMDDGRVLVESGAEMTPVPHEPSEFEKNIISLTSHFNHCAHHVSNAKHNRNHTNEQSASSKTANSQ